jgi:hypothetical protein
VRETIHGRWFFDCLSKTNYQEDQQFYYEEYVDKDESVEIADNRLHHLRKRNADLTSER